MRRNLIAAIDIGSRAVRMKIGELNKKGLFKELDSFNRSLPLGHNTFLRKRVDFKTVDMLCDVLHNFKQIIDEYEINDYSVVATSAIREATNKNYIIDQINIKTGFDVQVIDNNEEQFLTVRAIRSNLKEFNTFATDGVLIVAIGGGSIQITSYKDGKLTSSNNLKLGALRIREILQPLKNKSLMYRDVLKEYIEMHLSNLKEIETGKYKHLVVVGGEINIINDITKSDDKLITKKDIVELYEKIQHLTEDEIVGKYKIGSENARVLFPSLVLLNQFVDAVDSEEIIVPNASLIDGIVINLYEKTYVRNLNKEVTDDIIMSAKVVAKKYSCDEEHYSYVEDVAMQIFKKLSKVHGLKREMLLLRASAMLCDVGDIVSIVDSSINSYKIITMSELFGISGESKEMIALVAKYCNDLVPNDSNNDFGTVSEKKRVTVAKLIAIMKLAKSLDMTGKQKIKIKMIKLKDKTLIIKGTSKVDTTLEVWDFKVKSKYLKEVFGINAKLTVKKEF